MATVGASGGIIQFFSGCNGSSSHSTAKAVHHFQDLASLLVSHLSTYLLSIDFSVFASPTSFSCLSAGRYLTTKEQLHEFLEAKGQEKPSQESEAVDPAGNDLTEPEAKRIRLEDGQTEDGQAEDAGV